MIWPPRSQMIWGFLGATAAAWFAIWMLFFPQYVPDYFAWNVVPRYAQVFIGAGYLEAQKNKPPGLNVDLSVLAQGE